MTTIVCNKEAIACDLQYTVHGGQKFKGVPKIRRFQAHPNTYTHCDYIMGCAGAADEIITVIEFFSSPDSFKTCPNIKNVTGLVLTEEGIIYTFNNPGRWLVVQEPLYAIGSGSPFALGAMAAGATLKQAIKIASQKDPFTGMGFKQLSFK